MHARMIKRNLQDHRWRFILIAATVITLQLGALMWATDAHAGINVSFVTVKQASHFTTHRTYAGRVIPTRSAELGFKRGGEIAEVKIDVGVTVHTGQLLATLNQDTLNAAVREADADVAFAKASLKAAEADTQLAVNTEQRLRRLLVKGHTSRQTYDEANLALGAKRAQLDVARSSLQRAIASRGARLAELAEATVTAPFTGTIQTRYVDEGAQVGPGQPVLRLVENDQIEAHVGIPTHLAQQMEPGGAYTLVWQQQNFAATLSTILPEVDPATRTLTAVLNLDANIPLGAVVEMQVAESVQEPGFWLPISALTAGERGLWGVMVINANNTVERRLVDVVHTEAQRVFARGTLSDEDRIVRAGVQRVVPGQRVTPVAFKG